MIKICDRTFPNVVYSEIEDYVKINTKGRYRVKPI